MQHPPERSAGVCSTAFCRRRVIVAGRVRRRANDAEGRRTVEEKGINGRVGEFILDREFKMFHEVETRLVVIAIVFLYSSYDGIVQESGMMPSR